MTPRNDGEGVVVPWVSRRDRSPSAAASPLDAARPDRRPSDHPARRCRILALLGARERIGATDGARGGSAGRRVEGVAPTAAALARAGAW